MNTRNLRFLALFGLLALSVPVNTANADILCLKATSRDGKATFSKRTVANLPCPRKFFALADTSIFTGPAGADGEDGEDGSLRIYGDGSAGALSVTGATALSGTNFQYTDVTIDAGANFQVPSGTVIRCTGTFTLNGSITVMTGGVGGVSEASGSAGGTTSIPATVPASQGVSFRAAQSGEIGPDTIALRGGLNQIAISTEQASLLRYPGLASCGAGAASLPGTGGNTGGAITILCSQGISIGAAGTINANGVLGNSGGGGGSGGIVILASPTSIANAGSTTANGGNGGPSTAFSGAAGGGGGGIVHLISPTVTAGTITVTAGAAGSTATAVTQARRSGGGSGGSCGGAGGNGSDVASNDTQSNVSAGGAGLTISTTADPTGLF